MKILLVAINAKYIHSNLAVYNLAAYAGRYSAEVEIAEFTINHYVEYILEEIYKKKPDVIAFSCYIWNFNYIKELVGDLNKLLPDVPIWIGGPEVSYDSLELLEKFPQIKGVMVGEGEKTFCELATHYVDQSIALDCIKGILFRNDNDEIETNEPRELMNMDDIPFCYSDMDKFKNKIIYYETSRGCPFSCSYCLSSIDKRVRFRSLELVEKELKYFMNHKIPQVKFVDRTFNCNANHSRAIWRYILENDNGITNFHFEIGADLLKAEDLEIMSRMRPGLIQLEIGVQSTNISTIHEINRAMDFNALKDVVEKINSMGNIHQHLDLIAGLPYEGYDSFRKSFNDVYCLNPEQLQLGFLKVLKGSNMHEWADKYGIIYRTNPVYEVLYTKWLNHDELLAIKKVEEMVELYYNSRQFTNTVKWLSKVFESPFDCFQLLGNFYEERGYSGVSQSRMTRYDILLEFSEKYDKQNIELYKELLLYDLYLRENLKARPSWAADLTEYKEVIKEFYIQEDEERNYLTDYEGFHYKQLSKMTHVEVFSSEGFINAKTDGKVMILFDYNKRNPLTYEAFTQMVGELE
ncbi:MAG: B12-binding domain-containing radical SAM protein [Lachnotalea sp.]